MQRFCMPKNPAVRLPAMFNYPYQKINDHAQCLGIATLSIAYIIFIRRYTVGRIWIRPDQRLGKLNLDSFQP